MRQLRLESDGGATCACAGLSLSGELPEPCQIPLEPVKAC